MLKSVYNVLKYILKTIFNVSLVLGLFLFPQLMSREFGVDVTLSVIIWIVVIAFFYIWERKREKMKRDKDLEFYQNVNRIWNASKLERGDLDSEYADFYNIDNSTFNGDSLFNSDKKRDRSYINNILLIVGVIIFIAFAISSLIIFDQYPFIWPIILIGVVVYKVFNKGGI
jgi:hypothetical protein